MNWVAQTSFVSITTSAIPVVETVYFTFNICGFGGAAQTYTYTCPKRTHAHTKGALVSITQGLPSKNNIAILDC